MRKFGVIGLPAAHSFSPAYFNQKFAEEHIQDCIYHYYELTDLSDMYLLVSSGLVGMNITSPYKEEAVSYCDSLDDSARQINAVNTIYISDGKMKGYNTDIYGIEQSILKEKKYITNDKCLILGTGGASRAVTMVLKNLGYVVRQVSRTAGDLRYDELTKEIVEENGLIINATPIGMHPNINQKPDFPIKYLNPDHFVYDLIYNPEKTVFLTEAEQHGARIKNGYEMLKFQAEKSWEIWNQ